MSDLWHMCDRPKFLGAPHLRQPQQPVYQQKLFDIMTFTFIPYDVKYKTIISNNENNQVII